MAVCFKSHHATHEPCSVFDVLSVELIVSGAGLVYRTVNAVENVGQYQIRTLEKTEARLQLIHVLQLIKRSILDEPKLSHGYCLDLNSERGFRL